MKTHSIWPWVVACLMSGCGAGSTATVASEEPTASAASSAAVVPHVGGATLVAAAQDATSETLKRTPTASDQGGEDESWDSLYLNGSKAGYSHTQVTHVEEDGRPVVKVDVETRLSIKRFGQTIESTMRFTSYETADGDLVRFDNQVENSPGSARGWVEGDKLVIEVPSTGKPIRHAIDWPGDVVGYSGEERLLTEAPLKPGDRRTMKTLAPIFNKIAEVQMVAEDFEEVKLLDRTARLLRVVTTNSVTPGFTTVLWIDEHGDALKSSAQLGFLEQTTYRTSRDDALKGIGDGLDTDLGFDTLVRVEQPIPDAHRTREVTYQISVEDADPVELFAEAPTQSIQRLDAHTIELRVRAVGPDSPDRDAGDKPAADVPAEYVDPNALVQSDDAEVVRLAEQAAAGASEPWEVATRIERWVFENLADKNFTRAFESAAEVARDLEGDCTEHAVLVAALARARKVPSRVAVGLVYMERGQAFAYHMWTEVFVRDTWVPVDGTLGRGGIGAAHIKLSSSSLAGLDVAEQFLQVLQVLGKTSIKVVDVKH